MAETRTTMHTDIDASSAIRQMNALRKAASDANDAIQFIDVSSEIGQLVTAIYEQRGHLEIMRNLPMSRSKARSINLIDDDAPDYGIAIEARGQSPLDALRQLVEKANIRG